MNATYMQIKGDWKYLYRAVNSRQYKIRFSKSTLHGVTKNQFFDDHVSDPIARSRSPYAPSRII